MSNTRVTSFRGGKCTGPKVVELPPFIKPGQQPMKFWAEDGLIYCMDPNNNVKPLQFSQPLDILQRVVALLKIVLADYRQNPSDYIVKLPEIQSFFIANLSTLSPFH